MEFHFYFTSVEANKGVMQYRISLTLSEMAEFAQLAWNQHPSNALLGGICTFSSAGLKAKIWVFHHTPLAQQ